MNQAKIRKELLSKIDQSSAVEREKVDRYISLLKVFYKLDRLIKPDNVMIKIENGKQVYWKSNPAIAEKNRINTALIALEKDFKYSVLPTEKPKTKVVANGKEYDPGDLV
ncbi:gp1 protein [Lactobacillus plantarum JDM1] [Lactiplantibacillus mudanjiangensis]|uniref:P27 family phage terminase small subunit n=1 Tax=Lactiplantibacillus mudanjiangensis TaxID=1296538 RepID=UPI0010141446|nr:gp1 protein [Lactobacillus plantarum JDM1] [Lactiplantibacillus mudanjiangensis]